MKDYKKNREQTKQARSAKHFKRQTVEPDYIASRGPGRKIPVCPESLSEESQRSYGIPEFYEDEYYKCIECGKETLFSAEQQKQWYEVEKRYLFQGPIRCRHHFFLWLSDRKTKFRMDKALEYLNLHPDSKDAMRDYALSIVEFHKNTGNGNLHTAVHLLRKLNKDPDELAYCIEQIKKAHQASS